MIDCAFDVPIRRIEPNQFTEFDRQVLSVLPQRGPVPLVASSVFRFLSGEVAYLKVIWDGIAAPQYWDDSADRLYQAPDGVWQVNETDPAFSKEIMERWATLDD